MHKRLDEKDQTFSTKVEQTVSKPKHEWYALQMLKLT